jgi:hypothetical protein
MDDRGTQSGPEPDRDTGDEGERVHERTETQTETERTSEPAAPTGDDEPGGSPTV